VQPLPGRSANSGTLSSMRDAALDFAMEPVPANQTGTVQIPGNISKVSLKAAVWADGTTFGEAGWIHKLLLQRITASRHVELVLALLQESIRANTSPADIATMAKEKRAQVDREVDDPQEAALSKSYYTIVIRRMTEETSQSARGAAPTDQQRITAALKALTRARDRIELYR
jgi:hypothetical protein